MQDTNQKVYLTARLDSLKEGMVVPSDIYAANRDILLIRAGSVLDARKIEALERINNYENIINIAFESTSQLIEYKLSCKVVNAEKIEEETGYTEVKDMAEELIEELESAEIIEHDKANEMSEELCDRLENTSQEVIISLINSLGPVDEYLPRHCVEVGMLCGLLGRWLGYSKPEVDKLAKIGLLHDCGKASTPKQILGAPRKLSVAEFEVIKMHSIHSHDMLLQIPEDVRLAARYHHERLDGNGYPDGISGDTIPVEAKITAICDIYDAMVSRRSYKTSQSPFLILKSLEKLRTSELDPALVDIFVKNMLTELIEKPVMLSNGEVAVVSENDPDDIEFPYVRTEKGVIKTSSILHCTSMYYMDRE